MQLVEQADQCPSTVTLPVIAVAPPPSPVASRADPPPAADRTFQVLGVRITDVTRNRATQLIGQMLAAGDGTTRAVFFVNAHTLNLAAADGQFREVLNSADYVFGDGTGVRWAARLQGIRVRDNLAGTDLTPLVFETLAANGYRYFLLGGTKDTVRRAAEHAAQTFQGWTLAGYHHGYIHDARVCETVIQQINQARPHLLLVGMGNPLQERWIAQHRRRLQVPLCMAVGGLFAYWAGQLTRSPRWLRRLGAEWIGILCQQPHKARRYLLGNPLFLWRIWREHLRRPAGVGLLRWTAKKLARRTTVLLGAVLKAPANCRHWPANSYPTANSHPTSKSHPTPGTAPATTNCLSAPGHPTSSDSQCGGATQRSAWLPTLLVRRAVACRAKLRVLTYHRCGFARRDPFCISPDDFSRQMQFLAENDLAVSLDDLEEMLAGRKPLRDRAVLVTADDGFRSVLTEMMPIWRHYRIPAVVFVSPGLVPEQNTASSRQNRLRASVSEPYATGVSEPYITDLSVAYGAGLPEPYMTWDELAELRRCGITIGSHGLTHRSLGKLPPEELFREACQSRRLLESKLACKVTAFAYPYGTRADFSPSTARALAEAGYTVAFTSQHGAITAGADPLELPRMKIESAEGLWMFRSIVAGGLDGWRLVDRWLWPLQQRRRLASGQPRRS